MKKKILFVYGLVAIAAMSSGRVPGALAGSGNELSELEAEKKHLMRDLHEMDIQDKSACYTCGVDSKAAMRLILKRVKERTRVQRDLDEVKRMVDVLKGRSANLGESLPPTNEALYASFDAVMKNLSATRQIPDENDPSYATQREKYWQALLADETRGMSGQGKVQQGSGLE